jgi:hypothetical protein
MINVGVCENDAADRRAQDSSRSQDPVRSSGNACIDKGKPVVFLDQETIDHAELSQTAQISCLLNKLQAEPQEFQ